MTAPVKGEVCGECVQWDFQNLSHGFGLCPVAGRFGFSNLMHKGRSACPAFRSRSRADEATAKGLKDKRLMEAVKGLVRESRAALSSGELTSEETLEGAITAVEEALNLAEIKQREG